MAGALIEKTGLPVAATPGPSVGAYRTPGMLRARGHGGLIISICG